MASRSPSDTAVILAFMDEFKLDGPSINNVVGKHHCLVLRLAKMTVKDAQEQQKAYLFPLLVARADGKPLDPWVPSQSIAPVFLGARNQNLSLGDAHMILVDFSESFRPATETKTESYTPFHLRAPEMLIDAEAPI